MARVECIDTKHTEALFEVTGLKYIGSAYDKFVWHFFQEDDNGELVEIMTYTYDWNADLEDYKAFEFYLGNYDDDGNLNYLGNNVFSPGTEYYLELDLVYGSDVETVSCSFTTDSVNMLENRAKITPCCLPKVKDQYDLDDEEHGNCVAQCLSTIMEVMTYKRSKDAGGDGRAEQYSVAFIYGSDQDSENVDYMVYEDAVMNCIDFGSPRWELATKDTVGGAYFPDNRSKSDSIKIFKAVRDDSFKKANALNQRFTSAANVDFYETEEIADCIEKYGAFMFNFKIPHNFFEVGEDGIVPQPDEISDEDVGHSMPLIGLTVKNGKKHWIAQNSWGVEWGDNGRCYVPLNWGCGVLAPTRKTTKCVTSWTSECYSVESNVLISVNEEAPVIQSAIQVDAEKKVRLSWTGSNVNEKYIVFARDADEYVWWEKDVVYETQAEITVDRYSKYEFMVVGVNSENACSPQSKVATAKVSDGITRPDDFSWRYSKSSGFEFNLRASEWKNFCDSCIEFLRYIKKLNTVIGVNSLGLPEDTTYYGLILLSTETAIRGEDFTAEAFNYIKIVIDFMNANGTGIELQQRGDMIYASYLNTLVDKLNEIE